MKTNIKRTVRVRASGCDNACTGCVFQMDTTDYGYDQCFQYRTGRGSVRKCVDIVGANMRNYIFIRPGKRARAKYLALILEHGVEQP